MTYKLKPGFASGSYKVNVTNVAQSAPPSTAGDKEPEWTSFMHREYGKCFTFDPGTLHPETVGNDGLSIIFESMPSDTQTGDSGILVVAHDAVVTPNMYAATRVASGFATTLSLTRRRVSRLSNDGGKKFHEVGCVRPADGKFHVSDYIEDGQMCEQRPAHAHA